MYTRGKERRERKLRAWLDPLAFLSFVVCDNSTASTPTLYAERVNYGMNDALPYLGMGGEIGGRWWVSYRDMVE